MKVDHFGICLQLPRQNVARALQQPSRFVQFALFSQSISQWLFEPSQSNVVGRVCGEAADEIRLNGNGSLIIRYCVVQSVRMPLLRTQRVVDMSKEGCMIRFAGRLIDQLSEHIDCFLKIRFLLLRSVVAGVAACFVPRMRFGRSKGPV